MAGIILQKCYKKLRKNEILLDITYKNEYNKNCNLFFGIHPRLQNIICIMDIIYHNI